MLDKTDQIFKGAISVFIKKGLQATTQEVAKEAGVAEVTLYRRYSTKENLFITVIKHVLENKFGSHVLEIAKEKDTELFLTNIIENRLEVLSKNYDLIRMLLSESLRGNLTDKINLPEIIFSSIKKGLECHFKRKDHQVDIDFCARQLGGVFLSYLILPNDQQFNKLTMQERRDIARKHAKSILSTM
ncbi:TetR/AcrR family transcriptional regulator [Virgibacillus dokdonensis]|uniref:TetR/AcrR family transcriptional regulator n=1 Tax=Virgibacillus dokdonensis TaxID=302167 RepID=UPI00098A4F0D|nr:TetR/AcrR family transcriptional regulator [Virgibacillus dokdonensis]